MIQFRPLDETASCRAHEEAADHRSEHNNNAYDGEHDALPEPCDWVSAAVAPRTWRLSLSPIHTQYHGFFHWAQHAKLLTVSEPRSPHQRKSAVRATRQDLGVLRQHG